MTVRGMRTGVLLVALGGLGLAPVCTPAWAQGFVSGSDGSDGALNIAGGQGVVNFDPSTLRVDDDPTKPLLDADGDRVFHFTTVSVGAGTTLRLSGSTLGLGKPIHWLASGAVAIDGVLDLDGRPGHAAAAPHLPADPGAGGYEGGIGASLTSDPTAGGGPGGGELVLTGTGGSASYAIAAPGAGAGAVYGNEFLLPLVGGSGGAGGCQGIAGRVCDGGGAGGGAILIASSVSIAVNGEINARGGDDGPANEGGAGSGGAIRLVAPTCSGSGSVNVIGGTAGAGDFNQNPGRVRIEAFNQQFTNASPPRTTTFARPGLVFLPASAPRVRVVSITTPSGDVLVPAQPTSSFVVPDAIIATGQPVTLNVAAENIPITATVTIRMVPANGTPQTLTLTGLTGTTANSTGTLGPVTLPTGFSRFSVSATFTP